MNTIVDIAGSPHALARLDRAAIEALYDSGTLEKLGKVELIDGVLVQMSPAHLPHGETIATLIGSLFPLKKHGYRIATDVGVFLEDTTMRAPDLIVAKAEAPDGFLTAKDAVLVIEVSASTLREDLDAKAREYAARGISEYWVVDLVGREAHVHHDPSAEGYTSIQIVTENEAIRPLCAPELDVIVRDILPNRG